MIVLAGDIGGTHTRLLCAAIDGNKQQVIAEKSFPSAEYDDFEEILNLFLSEHKVTLPIEAACIAVAGPVQSGTASVTNLPWVISENKISNALSIPRVKLINDFIAVVHGIAELDESDVIVLHQGRVDNNVINPDAAVIGAGTGLGVAHRVWLSDRYNALSSEAGHVGFAPETEQQTQLLAWLQKTHEHVSLEMLLSGKGLATIYQFFHQMGDLPASATVDKTIQQKEPAQVISDYAISGDDELCKKTLECFIEIYGATAGNVALQYFPVHEVYIAGGIAPKVKGAFLEKRFIKAFINKGPMSSNMEKITIKLITQEKVGLYGALSNAKTI